MPDVIQGDQGAKIEKTAGTRQKPPINQSIKPHLGILDLETQLDWIRTGSGLDQDLLPRTVRKLRERVCYTLHNPIIHH